MTYQPIEDYGIIGDLYTVALVGMDGSIDFMSYPHFDSPTVFAAILDHDKGGRFRIAPVLEESHHKQNVLAGFEHFANTLSLGRGRGGSVGFYARRRGGHGTGTQSCAPRQNHSG